METSANAQPNYRRLSTPPEISNSSATVDDLLDGFQGGDVRQASGTVGLHPGSDDIQGLDAGADYSA